MLEPSLVLLGPVPYTRTSDGGDITALPGADWYQRLCPAASKPLASRVKVAQNPSSAPGEAGCSHVGRWRST